MSDGGSPDQASIRAKNPASGFFTPIGPEAKMACIRRENPI